MLEQADSLWFETTQQDALVTANPPSAAFGPLLRTVFEAIFEVFLMCFMGWVLAKKGILDKKTQKQLNRVNVSLFTPCLLFSKVAFSLSPSKLKELWIIPILFVIVTAVSAIIAYLVGTALRLRRSQRNFAMAAAMFNNSNSLPIALMQSLVVTVHGLKWGQDDNKDAMLGRALGYLVLYSTLGMMLRWSYGVHLLAQSDEEISGIDENAHEALDPEHDLVVPLSPTSASTSLASTPSSSSSRLSGAEGNDTSSYFGAPPRQSIPPELQVAVGAISEASSHLATTEAKRTRSGSANGNSNLNGNAKHRLRPPPLRSPSKRFFSSFPNSPARSSSPSPAPTPNPRRITFTIRPPKPSNARERAQSAAATTRVAADTRCGVGDVGPEGEEPDLSDSEWGTHQPSRQPHAQPSSTRFEHYRRRAMCLLKKFSKGFFQFMTMPLYAALASFVVALTPPLQHALSEHVQPVKGFLASAGSCSIPITLVVLGAYFYQEQSPSDKISAGSSSGVAAGAAALTVNWKGKGALGRTNSRGSNVVEAHAAHARSPSDAVLPTHNQRVPMSKTTTISDAETGVVPSSPWASATTLAGSVREAFKLRGVRARLTQGGDGGGGGGGNSDNKTTEGEIKTVFASVISRMILTPIVILPMFAALAAFVAHPIFDDPVFVCSTVLLISAPPALTLAQITQAASGDAFERLISRTIFWAYCVFTPPLTLFYVIIALHFTRL